MKLVLAAFLVAAALSLAGCGGGGNGGGSSQSSLNVGWVPSQSGRSKVSMSPAPPSVSPPSSKAGTSPAVSIYQVSSFNATVNDAAFDESTSTTQVAYGTVSNVTLANVQLVVFSYTNMYYVQPLTGCTVIVNQDGSWVCPSHAGTIHAVLVKSGYSLNSTYSSLPAVDGVNVLAET